MHTPQVDHAYNLPAGHAYRAPALTVKVTSTRYGEWVAYEDIRGVFNGCSRHDYFVANAERNFTAEMALPRGVEPTVSGSTDRRSKPLS